VKGNNGAVTKALVEGFTGRADYTGKGKITINCSTFTFQSTGEGANRRQADANHRRLDL
jgi:hypothetical protein